MLRTGWAAVAMLVLAAGCANEELASLDRGLSEYTGVSTGVVVLANPFNCNLTGEDIRRLNEIHAAGRLSVVVVFVGVTAADSVAVSAAATDLGLDTPYTYLPRTHLGPLTGSLEITTPSFALFRYGALVLLVSNVSAERGIDLLQAAYGPKR